MPAVNSRMRLLFLISEMYFRRICRSQVDVNIRTSVLTKYQITVSCCTEHMVFFFSVNRINQPYFPYLRQASLTSYINISGNIYLFICSFIYLFNHLITQGLTASPEQCNGNVTIQSSQVLHNLISSTSGTSCMSWDCVTNHHETA